jgi:hypothetical protein
LPIIGKVEVKSNRKTAFAAGEGLVTFAAESSAKKKRGYTVCSSGYTATDTS